MGQRVRFLQVFSYYGCTELTFFMVHYSITLIHRGVGGCNLRKKTMHVKAQRHLQETKHNPSAKKFRIHMKIWDQHLYAKKYISKIWDLNVRRRNEKEKCDKLDIHMGKSEVSQKCYFHMRNVTFKSHVPISCEFIACEMTETMRLYGISSSVIPCVIKTRVFYM